MKEVIERMLKVEQEARAILDDAERRSNEVRDEYRREADEESERIRSSAQEDVSGRLDHARLELKAKRDDRLRKVDEANQEYADEVRTRFAAASDLVVKRLIGEQD